MQSSWIEIDSDLELSFQTIVSPFFAKLTRVSACFQAAMRRRVSCVIADILLSIH